MDRVFDCIFEKLAQNKKDISAVVDFVIASHQERNKTDFLIWGSLCAAFIFQGYLNLKDVRGLQKQINAQQKQIEELREQKGE